MHLLREVWSILTPRQKRWAVFAQLLSLIMALSTLTGIASIAPFFAVLGNPQVIDRAGALHSLYAYFGFANRRSFEVALGMAFLTMVIVSNLINFAGSFALTRLSWWIGTGLQSRLFGAYIARPYVFHTKTHSAVLLNNIIHEASRTTNDIVLNIFVLVTNIAAAALIILSVMILNPRVAAGMLLALFGGYFLIYLAVRHRTLRAGQVQSYFFIEQAKIVNETLGAIKEVIVLRIQGFFRKKFEASSVAYARAAAHTVLIRQSPRHVMECVAVAGLVAVALISVSNAGIGALLGHLTFIGFAAYRLLPILQQIFAAIVQIRTAQSGFAIIAADLRPAPAGSRLPTDAELRWAQKLPRVEISLNGVCFGYEPGRRRAADSVSLRIPAQAAVGFVGANASGKTTLVDVIAGLLSPQKGELKIDGVAIDESNRDLWRSKVAYVPQDIFLLDTTIAQNIALGFVGDEIDGQRMRAAAQLAQLDQFVDGLAEGYEYTIGERGIRLSGGQRQRLGIARALYTEASVLILDEATNALDGLTEQDLIGTMLRLRGRYTIILIAHRLSTLRACDLIFELDDGKIVASGTYSELLRTSDTFRRSALAHQLP
jgi:ATP-binding cassette, subfamily B, bacterial PglK